MHRKPQLSDGTEAFEEITTYEPYRYFEYEVSGFTNVLNRFVTGAKGSWTFSETPGGTTIVWTYAFHPRPRRTLAVRMIIAPFWRRYMRLGLRLTVQEIERQRGAQN